MYGRKPTVLCVFLIAQIISFMLRLNIFQQNVTLIITNVSNILQYFSEKKNNLGCF